MGCALGRRGDEKVGRRESVERVYVGSWGGGNVRIREKGRWDLGRREGGVGLGAGKA